MVIYLLYVKLSETEHINRLLDRRHLFPLNKAEKSQNIIAKLQDLSDLSTQIQASPSDGAGSLETVNLSPSSGAGTGLPSQATEPEAKPAGSATPEAVEAQEPITCALAQAIGFLTGTNGCTPRYSVIATGGNAERNTAMIADELSGDSYHVTVGQTLPFGVEVISIDDEVVVRDTLGDQVLPYVSDGWKNNDAGGYADDEFIFFKIEPKQTEHDLNVILPTEILKSALQNEAKIFFGPSLE